MKVKKLDSRLALNKNTVANLESNEMNGLQAGKMETGCIYTYCCKVTNVCIKTKLCAEIIGTLSA
ncbi:MAG: hypothetical protein GY765_32535 [bacterium]|nr:hypothetical protein [bacterium]